jgi:hypothetical protein
MPLLLVAIESYAPYPVNIEKAANFDLASHRLLFSSLRRLILLLTSFLDCTTRKASFIFNQHPKATHLILRPSNLMLSSKASLSPSCTASSEPANGY